MSRKLLGLLLLFSLPLALFFLASPARASTTITVNSKLDAINASDNKCTLREAIIAANTNTASGGVAGECPAGSGADTIALPAGTFTLTIAGIGEGFAATGDLDVNEHVTIQGNGSACLFNPNCTLINANSLDRAFDISTSVQATISGLDIINGVEYLSQGGAGIRNYGVLKLSDAYLSGNLSGGPGGALYNAAGASATLNLVGFLLNGAVTNGGAIYNSGTMTLTKTIFNLDSAQYGGGIYNDTGTMMIMDSALGGETATYHGGGIYTFGFLTLDRVSLSSNKATSGNGGGLYNGAYVTLTNATFSSNVASSGIGGGLYAGAVTMASSTIYSNTAGSGGGIGGVSYMSMGLKNTILYNNTPGNCEFSGTPSLGYNLDGANTCGFSATGDMTSTLPLLGPLQYNGGWHLLFQTHALLPGSPAINSGTNIGCPAVDARAFTRVGPCDRGAFEYVLRLMLPLIMR